METVRVFYLLSRFIIILHRCKWHAFLNWLPQIKQSVCCVTGEVKAINSCVDCILQTTIHGATQPGFHSQLWQDIAAERAISNPILLDCQKRQTGSSLCCNWWLCCCLLTERHKKSTLWCSFVYICVQTASWPAVCVSVLWNGEQSNFFFVVAIFKFSGV